VFVHSSMFPFRPPHIYCLGSLSSQESNRFDVFEERKVKGGEGYEACTIPRTIPREEKSCCGMDRQQKGNQNRNGSYLYIVLCLLNHDPNKSVIGLKPHVLILTITIRWTGCCSVLERDWEAATPAPVKTLKGSSILID